MDEMGKARSRWFGHVKKKFTNALVRRCERLDIVGTSRVRSRPNKYKEI